MRRRELLLSALALPLPLLSACGSTGDGEAAPTATAADLPMSMDGTHASVSATINGRSLRLLLDSGADQNTLTPQAVAALGLTPSATGVPSSGASGDTGLVPWVEIAEIALQGAVARNTVAYVVPVPEEFSYDGILGAAFFRLFTPSFDYAAGRLRLVAAGRFEASAGQTSLPMQVLPSGKLLVQASVAGQTGWFSIDTGASNAVTLFTPTVERMALRHMLQPTVRMATGLGTNGVTYGDMARLPALLLGPWRFEHVLAELSLASAGLFGSDAWMGNLGAELWRRFSVTLDLANNRLLLAPNAAIGEPFAGPRSGLAARSENGRLRVIDVAAGSPAAQAGIQAGDSVLSIGSPPQTADPQRLRSALNQPAGTRVSLGLASAAGESRQVVIVLRELV